jgi:hypothetical protein
MKSTCSQFVRGAMVSAVVGAVTLASASCGEVARTGQSPAYLIIETIEASSGADPTRFGSILNSDVITNVTTQINGEPVPVPTVFNDPGRATFRLALKNPGSTTSPLGPTTLNEITITRYRVVFHRADGRNTQGVDIPYSFDGAFTLTVPAGGTAQGGFDIVRHQAKREPPLSNMAGGGAQRLISTIADITFYGRDQAGNEVSVTGSISVNFGDFGDPA